MDTAAQQPMPTIFAREINIVYKASEESSRVLPVSSWFEIKVYNTSCLDAKSRDGFLDFCHHTFNDICISANDSTRHIGLL